ncbi:hypothetical protein Poli38472_001134 [Pythium oligandrum]|uniref:Uncharacterized protein n=1 Tax=Pythium oligandrum TaxID=41045 RepID=A0A8K1CVF0_PYTOL|nr:hypothetical protein Poli38472_001134 [Pythium oligandrum]|eukprot:TMW68978.1 hypothetical protein Poli38472_001134 [Pythium oligandrum]
MAAAKKTILVTGSTRGIGLAFIAHYKQLGWHVIGAARDLATAHKLLALKPHKIVQLDVSNEGSILETAKLLQDQPIDLLVNNAGIVVRDSLSRASKADLLKQFEVNAIGPLLVTRAFQPHLRAAAGTNGSATVAHLSGIVASIGGQGVPGLYGYSASKAALNMFHVKLAKEFKKDKIISVSLHPGLVATEMMAGKGTPANESVAAVAKVIDAATIESSGKFLDYNGKEIAW